MTIDDFHAVSVIGKGAYAKVLLVKKKTNGQLCALKIIKKELIEKVKQEKYVLVERDVLYSLDHPFVIHFYGSFQTDKKLYFVLEYCPGGELFNLLRKKKRFSEERALFYAAQMVLALEHLHSKNIIYRDLKPENVLIDAQGYIRITDFGLSRMNVSGNDAMSISGTKEYLAPEVLLRLGYGKAADWWSLGNIIYEMIIGIPPFYTSNQKELFDRIKFANPKFPEQLPTRLRSLLEGLLKKDPSKRLGHDSAESIKQHPWFQDVNWKALSDKRYEAPFVPKVHEDEDLQHFDPQFTEIPINSMSLNEDGSSKQFKYFEGFTYDPDQEEAKHPQVEPMQTE